jgi:hypothetical protein
MSLFWCPHRLRCSVLCLCNLAKYSFSPFSYVSCFSSQKLISWIPKQNCESRQDDVLSSFFPYLQFVYFSVSLDRASDCKSSAPCANVLCLLWQVTQPFKWLVPPIPWDDIRLLAAPLQFLGKIWFCCFITSIWIEECSVVAAILKF